jgi:hypothetical protein
VRNGCKTSGEMMEKVVITILVVLRVMLSVENSRDRKCCR